MPKQARPRMNGWTAMLALALAAASLPTVIFYRLPEPRRRSYRALPWTTVFAIVVIAAFVATVNIGMLISSTVASTN